MTFRVVDDELMRPVNNNLTLVRLVLASAVIWTHSVWRLSGRESWDELTPLLGAPISSYAVDGFFFLSGYLVYASLLRRGSVGAFLSARLARLWPGLAAAVIAIVAFGASVTNASGLAYLRGDTMRFLLGNLSLTHGAYTLTGVACEAGPCNVDGSLWTITWEARCYLLLALSLWSGLCSPVWMKRLILPAVAIFAILIHLPQVAPVLMSHGGRGLVYNIGLVDRLMTMFALGVAAYVWRDRIVLSWRVFVVLLLILVAVNRLVGPLPHLGGVVMAYFVLCFGFASSRNGPISSRWPDYSYGIYIYAFPVMMVLSAIWRFNTYALLALATLLATLPIAAVSWHTIEKPALELVRVQRLRRSSKAVCQSPVVAAPDEVSTSG